MGGTPPHPDISARALLAKLPGNVAQAPVSSLFPLSQTRNS